MPKHPDQTASEAPSGIDRRKLLTRTGKSAMAAAFLGMMGPVGEAIVSGKAHAQSAITDADILNFALNLEYLEGEYYSRGVSGVGLPASIVTGTGTAGGVNGGTQVPFANAYFLQIASKIVNDEIRHINFIRNALGSAAVARPLIDLAGGFQSAALASGAISAGQTFNPFGDELSFFIGAFALEEVGVTAYAGAAALISNPQILTYASAILAIEAYHAGSIRGVLTQSALGGGTAGLVTSPSDAALSPSLPFITQAIATAQSQASNQLTANGIVFPGNGSAQISSRDGNALAYQRTTAQVLSVVQGGPNKTGGNFFPNGLNGKIH